MSQDIKEIVPVKYVNQKRYFKTKKGKRALAKAQRVYREKMKAKKAYSKHVIGIYGTPRST